MLNVNPTRMELINLKSRLLMARRGHKLLKDKLDEMVKVFMELLEKVKKERKEVESILSKMINSFAITSFSSMPEVLEVSYVLPWKKCSVVEKKSHLVGIKVSDFEVKLEDISKDINFRFFNISKEFKNTINLQTKILFNLVKLAESEFKLNILGNEILKTRRRVNALEYRMIPDILITIKMITQKIEENERSTIIRIMKIKDIVRNKY